MFAEHIEQLLETQRRARKDVKCKKLTVFLTQQLSELSGGPVGDAPAAHASDTLEQFQKILAKASTATPEQAASPVLEGANVVGTVLSVRSSRSRAKKRAPLPVPEPGRRALSVDGKSRSTTCE